MLYFEWWRWLFLVGCIAPVYDLCTVGMRLLLLLLQSSFFAYKGLLFFVLNIQVSAGAVKGTFGTRPFQKVLSS